MTPSIPEVKLADADIVRAGPDDVSELRRRAAAAPLGRARLCAHRDFSDPLHEMLIALVRGTYVRPHRHPGKTESFHVVEGIADVAVFDDKGAITDVVPIGDYASGRVFYYRLNVPAFHTILVRSEVITIHETTNGPFDRSDTSFAPWAPDAGDPAAAHAYLAELDRRLTAAAADQRA